jgi:hypothetical protein
MTRAHHVGVSVRGLRPTLHLIRHAAVRLFEVVGVWLSLVILPPKTRRMSLSVSETIAAIANLKTIILFPAMRSVKRRATRAAPGVHAIAWPTAAASHEMSKSYAAGSDNASRWMRTVSTVAEATAAAWAPGTIVTVTIVPESSFSETRTPVASSLGAEL